MFDISTIVGLGLAPLILYFGISSGTDWTVFLNSRAAIIVVGGTLVATLISSPFKMIPSIIKAFTKLFFEPNVETTESIVRKMVAYSKVAVSQGVESLIESPEIQGEGAYVREGVVMLSDGRSEHFIRETMESHIDEAAARHKMISDTFLTMGTFAPTFGLLGTVLGIIKVLRYVSDPKSVGPDMAVALLTTFYGIALANFVFIPLSGKLRARSLYEANYKQLVIEGLVCIHQGMLPIMVEQRLKAYLAEGKAREYE